MVGGQMKEASDTGVALKRSSASICPGSRHPKSVTSRRKSCLTTDVSPNWKTNYCLCFPKRSGVILASGNARRKQFVGALAWGLLEFWMFLIVRKPSLFLCWLFRHGLDLLEHLRTFAC